MATLEIIFIGLIAFAPVGEDEGVMLLTKAKRGQMTHYPTVVQMDGTCEGEACTWPGLLLASFDCEDDGKLCWVPFDADMSLADDHGALSYDVDRPLRDGLPVQAPMNASEAASLWWVPRVADVVPGPGSLRPSCRGAARDCNVWSRFWLQSGRLESCHFFHRLDCNPKDCELPLYQVGPHRQAVANAYSLTIEVDPPVRLRAWKFTNPQEMVEVELKPNCKNRIVLVVANEPLVSTASSSGQAPAQLRHYSSFYALLHPVMSLFGRMSDSVPERLPNDGSGFVGSCEDVVHDFADKVNDELKSVNLSYSKGFPAGGSECDIARVDN